MFPYKIFFLTISTSLHLRSFYSQSFMLSNAIGRASRSRKKGEEGVHLHFITLWQKWCFFYFFHRFTSIHTTTEVKYCKMFFTSYKIISFVKAKVAMFKKEPLFTAIGTKFIKVGWEMLVKNMQRSIAYYWKLHYYLNFSPHPLILTNLALLDYKRRTVAPLRCANDCSYYCYYCYSNVHSPCLLSRKSVIELVD